MSFIQSILMGLIQGLTEFLPVSSSGHLAIFKGIFGVETETGILFDVLLHLATLIAVCLVYYKDIWLMIKELVLMIGDIFKNLSIALGKGKKKYRTVISNSYRKFDLLIIVTTIPTGILGVLLKGLVEKASATLIFPGIFLIITAVLLLISDHMPEYNGTPKTTGFGQAALIGVAQGIATMPGLSRSGTSIFACLLCKCNRNFAVKYAFIMSIPAILGALVLEITDIDKAAINTSTLLNYGAGMLVAGVVGFICIKAMLVIVKKKKFTYFAFYCLFIGCLSLGAYVASVI